MTTNKQPLRYTNFTDNYFNDWLRANLPPPKDGIVITDIDFVIANYKSDSLMFIERKCKGRAAKPFQRKIFNNIHKAMQYANLTIFPNLNYRGFHKVTFDNDTFQNGQVWFDDKLVSESELIKILSI